MLEWEQFRLLQWADRVGFGDDQPSLTLVNWTLAYELFEHLHNDLSNAQVLKEKYGLLVVDQEGHPHDVAPEAYRVSAGPPFLGRMRSHATQKMQKIRKRAMEKGTIAYKSLKWAGYDQKKVHSLLDHVGRYNNYLRDLLDSTQQDFICTGVAALLRDLISRSSNSVQLDAIKAVLDIDPQPKAIELNPAVEVKRTRLVAGIDIRKDEKRLTPVAKPLLSHVKYKYLSSIASAGRENCETAIYRVSDARKNIHSHVLLEWKSVPISRDTAISKRIHELTFLLSAASASNCFHCLKCIGFVKVPGADFNRYAYVFELLDLAHRPAASLKTPQTLRAVIEEGMCVSLTRRLSIATTIAQTLLQMHTAGWLHKNISAESILFLKSESNETLSPPLLSGFEFARLTVEDTEALPPDPVTELYRHPQACGSAQGRAFQKTFDLYSFGCVFLEITLWTSLESILHSLGLGTSSTSVPAENVSTNKTPQQLAHERRIVVLKGRNRLMDKESIQKIGDQVAFHAGEQARKALELCFFPLERSRQNSTHAFEDDDDIDEDFLERSVNPQMRIVELLQSLGNV